MPDKSSIEKAYEDALAGKDAAMDADALAKKKAALAAAAAKSGVKVPHGKKRAPGTIQVDPRESDGTFNQPKAGTPVAKKPSPAKGMPY